MSHQTQLMDTETWEVKGLTPCNCDMTFDHDWEGNLLPATDNSQPADRDDLAAILAKHAMNRTYRDMTVRCWGCDWTAPYGLGVDSDVIHRAHVAQMVLESDWLRGVRAGTWDECFESGTPWENPYRADRVDTEDGGGE